MTEISFYHLKRQKLEAALPKLLERALDAGMKAVVLAGSPERVEDLDAALWTYDDGSFLPHGAAADGDPALQTIFLTTEEENPNDATLLAAVDGVTPGHVGSFERCLDLFDGNDEAAVEAARARWKAYKAAGHDVTYWRQSPDGKWEKQG